MTGPTRERCGHTGLSEEHLMKKTLLGGATAAAFLTVALATPASAQPPQDFVTGGGKHVGTLTQGISALSGPAGEDPHGNVTITQAGEGLFAHGEVTCLVVIGNQAFITWVVTSTNGFGAAEGSLVVTHVVDNGNPGESTVPDLIRNSFAGAIVEDPTNPGCFFPVFAPVPVEQGNYQVRDA
jgi:hypothetical protein